MEVVKKDFMEEANAGETVEMFDNLEFNQEARKVREEIRQEASKLNKEVQNFPGKLNIEIKKKDTLWKIVQENVYQYYPNLTEADKGKTLTDQIIEEIMKQNSIEDVTGIKEGTKITINMAEITKIIQSYLDAKNGNKEIPEKLEIEIKKKDTLWKIVQENVYQYYPNLTEADKGKTLTDQIIDKIIKQNLIEDVTSIREGTKITINMAEMTKIVQSYLDTKILDGGIPEKLEIQIKEGDTISKLVRENVYKYYPDLSEILGEVKLNQLTQKISEEVMKQNGIKDEKNVQIGTTITINMTEVTNIINKLKIESTNEIPQIFKYTIKEGDTLSKVITENIYKYYPNLTDEDKSRRLTDQISQEIMKQNGIKNDKNVKSGTELVIKTGEITKIIEKYLGNENLGNNNGSSGNNNEGIETIGDKQYITLSSMSDFRKGKDLVERVRNSEQRPQIEAALKSGKKVLIPAYIENKNSKVLKLEDIIKPDEIIDNKLAGKKFVLDPGHGFEDPGAIGLVKHGNNSDNTQVTIFESAIAMDMAYRTAKLLKSHGAIVEFTHYIPTRGICNLKDLPPCLQMADPRGYSHAKHQDKRRGQTENVTESVFQELSINTRQKITNEIGVRGISAFISMHMDAGATKSVLIDDKDPKKDDSKKFADFLAGNGFGKTVLRGTKRDGLGVLRTQCTSVLIEMGDIQSENDASRFRDPQSRQKKAEQLVNAMIKYYK